MAPATPVAVSGVTLGARFLSKPTAPPKATTLTPGLRMPRFARRLLTGLSFLVFAAGAGIISHLLVPRLRRRTRSLDEAARERERRAFFLRCNAWMVGWMRNSGLLSYSPPTLPDWLPNGPYVLIANHPSLIDVLVLKATVPGITCVVRADFWRRWWLRPMLEASHDIVGPDGTQSEIGKTTVLDAFVERLSQGDPVLVFPEGTRSPDRGLRRFRRGAIEAAVRAKVPIVPVVVRVDPPTLKHGQPWWDIPSRRFVIEVEFLPLISTTADTDSAAVAKQLRRKFEARLAAMAASG